MVRGASGATRAGVEVGRLGSSSRRKTRYWSMVAQPGKRTACSEISQFHQSPLLCPLPTRKRSVLSTVFSRLHGSSPTAAVTDVLVMIGGSSLPT